MRQGPLVVAATINAHLPWSSGRPDLDALDRLLTRPAWHADAACREPHPDVDFFPGLGRPVEPAITVCVRCLVRDDCLQAALDAPASQGIWGGTTAGDRQLLRRGDTDLDAIDAKRARTAEERTRPPVLPSCETCGMPLSGRRSTCSGCGAANPNHRAA